MSNGPEGGKQPASEHNEQPPAPRELSAEQLRFEVKGEAQFRSTQELCGAGEQFVGQERALASVDLALGLSARGYNLFVSGLYGANKLETLRDLVAHRAAPAPTPGDWVYVHDFARPDAPRAIYLHPGQGTRFKELMHELVKTLREQLPKAFRQEAFNKEKSVLREKFQSRAQEMNNEFAALARAKGFLVQPGPHGQIFFIPLIGDKPIQSPNELEALSDEKREEISRGQQELASELEQLAQKQNDLMRELEQDIREVERRFSERLLTPLLAHIEREIANQEVTTYLGQVKEHILNNLDDFKETPPAMPGFPMMPPVADRNPFVEYDVNVVVDNAATSGAPIIVESAPTYLNLFGTIERVVDRFGRVVTNFSRIKAGSFLRAHGGYLIFSLEDALTEPAVWKMLKRTLRSGRIEIETYEPFPLFSASGLRPEPIQVNTKVIVVGSALLYHLLHAWDEDFRDVFKVRADFSPVMPLDADHQKAYACWVAELCQEEGLPHFDQGAIARLVRFGAREAGDREKVLASQAAIADLAREAAFWARKEDSQLVSERHVQQALNSRVFRSNRVEEEIREMIRNGTLLVDVEGMKVGQINGLSVIDIGGYSFGRPSRVTASVGMGQAGIVNIERESRLSGSIHDKGVLILAGYLRNRFGQAQPLTLSASICFEQSYSGVEGDSASSTELYALISHLAGVPLRQDLAVTGSVNQWGEIQAIGGANEKVEGFYDVCRVVGLTGRQGVLIPEANVRHLILRDDVIDAVAQGKFHIYPVRTIEEGLTILTGMPAGPVTRIDTVTGRAAARLKELALGLKDFAAPGHSLAPDGAASTRDEDR